MRELRARVLVIVGLMSMLLLACAPLDHERGIDPPVGTVGPDSVLVGCEHAATRIVATVSIHLDPTCTYTRGVEIGTSGVTLDCRGARLESDGTEGRGVEIRAPVNTVLERVTVRNCVVGGFNNGLRVTRRGFKNLAPGAEYDHATSDILVEHSHFYRSSASGVFVDGYVTDVTLRDVEVAHSGSVGVYLEAGSKRNVVERSVIHRNGYDGTGPDGVPISVGGVELRYISTGREGIAVDGSRDNLIRGNWITANAAGGIFLYKNCGEDATSNPDGHWVRPYGANGNLVEGNVISSEPSGVWIGSRAAENQYFMDCSDTPYETGPLRAVYLDPATDNTVRGNAFAFVGNGVRVEDDRARVEANTFTDGDPTHEAVLIGTKDRSEVLGRAVTGTVVRANAARIVGNPHPYRFIHPHEATTFLDNRAGGAPAALVAGVQPPIDPWLFALSVFVP